MIIDTHCHLNTTEFDADLHDVITHANSNGVEKIICIGMYKEANLKALDIVNRYDQVYATIGIHPSYVNESYDETLLTEQLKTE